MEGLKCVALFVMVASALQFADAQSLINISGTVPCSVNGSTNANATTPTPPFPNALVELICDGIVRSSAITNGTGVFHISLNPVQVPLSLLLSPNCIVRVATPLSNCDETLPLTGVLQSILQFVGSIIQGIIDIFNVVPMEFEFTRN